MKVNKYVCDFSCEVGDTGKGSVRTNTKSQQVLFFTPQSVSCHTVTIIELDCLLHSCHPLVEFWALSYFYCTIAKSLICLLKWKILSLKCIIFSIFLLKFEVKIWTVYSCPIIVCMFPITVEPVSFAMIKAINKIWQQVQNKNTLWPKVALQEFRPTKNNPV